MALVTVLNDALRSWCFSASSSIQPDSVITTMVSSSAKLDHKVQAPAPELGKPSMPAPTQTLAMIQAPPITEGVRVTETLSSIFPAQLLCCNEFVGWDGNTMALYRPKGGGRPTDGRVEQARAE